MPIFSYMRYFDLEKIIRRLSGPDAAVSRRNRGGNQSRAPAELFCRGYFPPGGGNHCHHHHQQLSHLGEGYLHQHLHQHHLISNPSSSLVINLVTGTIYCCLWVTSSVDYYMVYLVDDYIFRSIMLYITPLILSMFITCE